MPYERMKLWGKLLHDLGERHQGRVVYASLTQAMLDDTRTEQPDADGVAEFIANARGADVTLLLRELGPAATRVSIRTSAAVSAAAIAKPFSGGGHVRRAGCTVPAPLQQAVAQVLDVCDSVLADAPIHDATVARSASAWTPSSGKRAVMISQVAPAVPSTRFSSPNPGLVV